MGKKKREKEELPPEELEKQHAEELPDREAMMVVKPPLVYGPVIPADDGGFLDGGPSLGPENV